MSGRALLLIDIQNDFLPGGKLPVPRGTEVIAVANRVQPHFELIVATQDWHPPDHGSFAANHPGHWEGDMIELAGEPQILWPVHCVAGTPGADFAPELDVSRLAHVVRKGTDPQIDSYSGFFDNGHRRATDLESFLRAAQVRDLYLLGLATDYCVLFTAVDARQLGFRTFLIEDGCRGVGLHPHDIPHALARMQHAGVTIMSSHELPATRPAGADGTAH